MKKRIPTSKNIKRQIEWLDKGTLPSDRAARVVREAMVYSKTGAVGTALRRECDKLNAKRRGRCRVGESGSRVEQALGFMAEVLDAPGVARVRGVDYVNTGDMYVATIAHDPRRGWVIESYSDLVQRRR